LLSVTPQPKKASHAAIRLERMREIVSLSWMPCRLRLATPFGGGKEREGQEAGDLGCGGKKRAPGHSREQYYFMHQRLNIMRSKQ
jgi:hypothetical protein